MASLPDENLGPGGSKKRRENGTRAHWHTQSTRRLAYNAQPVMSGTPTPALSPALSPVQRTASLALPRPPRAPRVCVVTGGTGFVGMRLVEMLVERGAERVISYDIVPAPADAWRHPAIEWVVGDVCDAAHLERVFAGVSR